jgi:hypothetical protein
MPNFELRTTRATRTTRQATVTRRGRADLGRGISGLGLVLVIVGLLALAIAYSRIPPDAFRWWPAVLIAVGLFGAVRRPGWVEELDLLYGQQVARAADRPRRIFSVGLVGLGCVCLLFTTGLLDARLVGPGILIALGLLLVWRRLR